ncbi:MAG: PKD domain-containing protein [Flavobacteriales bacterium]|nr:PKD domain-containing protein [Flavobacteriales bacterium]
MNHLQRTILCLAGLAFALGSFATHIIGGDMFYDHLGGNQYRVTLRLYRDCGPDNVNGTVFDSQAQLAVYNSAGSLINSFSVNFPGETTVPVELNDPCLSAPPTVCVASTEYVQVMTLPPIAGGYTISYQRCCRTPAMVNLNGQQGITCTVWIPGPPNAINGSPRFNDYPPIALCMGQDMSFDHSASDPDGDQLVYGLCAPYQGADAIQPAPLAPAPPYMEVNYAPGYSGTYPMDSNPPLAIDPVTGLLTVHPTVQGTFTVGVCVSEYRNGVLIGTARRDFMFRVVLCDASVTAVIAAQSGTQACSGLTQDFTNQSIGAQSYSWDFGDTTTTADVSTQAEPSYTYPAPGTYTVTLIANPGAPCADTTIADYLVAPPLDPAFLPPPILCDPQTVTLVATGPFNLNTATVTWDLGIGATPSSASGMQVTADFVANGVMPVTLTVSDFGCTDSFTANVQVYPQPEAAFAEQAEYCVSLTHAFVNESTDATGYEWHFGDPSTSLDQSVEESPSWTYGAQGFFTITMIATNGPVCTDTTSRIFDVHAAPNAFFYRPPIRCPGEIALFTALGAATGGVSVLWDFGAVGSPSASGSIQSHSAYPSPGVYPVTVTMTEFGCTASYTDSLVVYPYPEVDFINGSLACVGAEFPFASLATAWTPMSLEWNLGDGTTSMDSALVHTYSQAGTYTVSLTATTTTGCIASITHTDPGAVEVYPMPVAAFTALPEEVSLLDPRITVEDYSSLAVEWEYSIGEAVVNEPRFEYEFPEAGQYVIKQWVATEHGCADSTTRLVIVSDHLFYAPTAFTPDGDGHNEVWRPIVTGAREYELVIVDRWGHLVFRTTDPKEGWSGDGSPQSIFVYTARIKEWGSFAKEYTGHFSLLR